MFSRKLLRCGDLSEKDFWLLLIEQVEKDGVMKLYKWSDGGNASPKRTRTGAGADEGAAAEATDVGEAADESTAAAADDAISRRMSRGPPPRGPPPRLRWSILRTFLRLRTVKKSMNFYK